jgi:tRNA-2-methylthio-N6-dimethylallyladenosine synthase
MSKCVYKSLPEMKKARLRVTRPEETVASSEVPANVAAFAKGRLFYLKTYGCQANIRDEEILAGFLTRAGFTRTLDPRKASLAIINTCAVRENAEEKVYGEIGEFKANVAKDPAFILAVSGCMMQEEGVAAYLQKTYPYISLIFGTHNLADILTLLSEKLAARKNLVDIKSFPEQVVEDLPSIRLDPYRAYVNIAYGCDKFCTYCIVPYTRGRERSRRKEAILKECRELYLSGYQEVTLLGQNVNTYGLDLKDGTTFASLLSEVAEIGFPRVRFLTSYPSQFTDEMIEAMASHPNIMKWLHFPVQSGSTSCLKRMGRRYTREEYLALVEKIRAKMPSLALTTDIIVGFPNETEAEFDETLSLCEKVGYSAAFTFIYSPRKGTPAAAIKDDVTDQEKHDRFNRLVKVIEASTNADSEKMVGGTYEVLVEGPSKKDPAILTGYAENNKPINFAAPAYLTGCLVPVKVTANHTYSLLGELVGDPILLKARYVSSLMKRDPLLREYLALEQTVLSDPTIKKMGDDLVALKKKMCQDAMDKKAFLADKKAYEELLKKIQNHPLLLNKENLSSAVEEELLLVRDSLK